MNTTPKNVALQVGALIALFASITSFLILIFGVINIIFPDAAAGYYEYASSQSGIRYAIAMLVVFFPAFIFLTRIVNVARRSESVFYHSLTRWLMYFALLVGSLILLGDLVAVILTFLNGEITVRFVLKAGSILVVIGSALYYYWHDTKGYWKNKEKQSVMIGAIAGVIVIAGIVYGYMNIDSPAIVREAKIDQQQLTDLQDMQWRIESNYHQAETLPKTVAELYTDTPVPVAPESRDAYQYKVTGDTTYELCATFADITPQSERMMSKPYFEPGYDSNNYNWEHGAGEKCFERTVTKADKNI